MPNGTTVVKVIKYSSEYFGNDPIAKTPGKKH